MPPTDLHDGALIRSTSLDETRAIVSNAFCDHRLDLARGQDIDAQIQIRNLSELTIVRIAYGAAVVIAPAVIEDFYLLRLVLDGASRIETGQEQFSADTTMATIINPSQHTRILPTKDCRSLLIRLNRSTLEAALTHHLQRPLSSPLAFHPPIDLSSPGGVRLRRFIGYLVEELDDLDPRQLETRYSAQFEDVLVGMLLQFAPSNYSGVWGHVGPRISPRHVKRAIAFIEAHFDAPLTAQGIAEAAGVSVRTLSNGFQRFHEETTMGFLRNVRLRRAHELLELGHGDETTVTEIALGVGFAHLGRFSRDYRSRYGRLPSETLAQRRSSPRRVPGPSA